MIKNSLSDIELYADRFTGIYRGIIEDNSSDPLKAGRCKIRVWGLHTSKKESGDIDGVPTSDLPWAEPVCGLFGGSVSGIGAWTIPVQGSHVFLFFENGNIMAPRYFATVPGIPTTAANTKAGFNDPDGTYPLSDRLGEPDWNRLARGNPEPKEVKSPGYAARYPYNDVFKTQGGIIIELDSTPGNERVHVYHPSGSRILMNKDGEIHLNP